MPKTRDRKAYYQGYSGDTRDETFPKTGGGKQERIDLGIALLSCARRPGELFTYQEIAAWAGCTRAAIYETEKRALKALGNALRFGALKNFGKEL